MISDALREQGLTIEAKAIEIAEPIKQVGYYEIEVTLHKELKPKLKVWVVSSNVAAAPAPTQPESSTTSSPPAQG
jgi:ribosomal protein L9